MEVEYKELTTIKEFEECADLQRKIFNFTDLEVIPPALLRVFARPFHPIGVTVGCFKKSESSRVMIGFTIGIADFEKDSMYVPLIGILPEYQNKLYGVHLSLKIREVAYNKGFKYIYSSFDPLEIRIAKVYLGYGMHGIKYIANEYEIDENEQSDLIPADKILLKWDLASERVKKKVDRTFIPYNFKDAIQTIPIADISNMKTNSKILIEIPENFSLYKKDNIEIAKIYRLEIRKILNEFINNREYTLTECITGKIDKKRKTYYLLEKIALH